MKACRQAVNELSYLITKFENMKHDNQIARTLLFRLAYDIHDRPLTDEEEWLAKNGVIHYENLHCEDNKVVFIDMNSLT